MKHFIDDTGNNQRKLNISYFGYKPFSDSMIRSSERQSMSFDSNFEYYVGLFMASDIRKADMAERKPTIPDPFRLVTIERNGARSYSTSARQKAGLMENQVKYSDVTRNSRSRNITPTIPRSPNLSLSKIHGNKKYSTSYDRRSSAADTENRFESPHRYFGPPKLRLTEKNGDRTYSTFGGDTNKASFDLEIRPQSPYKLAVGPPKLRLNEKNGNRVYSSFAGGSFDRAGDNPINRSPSKQRQSKARLRPPKLTLTEKLGERHYSLFAANSSDTNDSLNSPMRNNLQPPKLRLLERLGERKYSTSAPFKQMGIISSQSWHESQQRTLTVPIPFHLSSSPQKFVERSHQTKKAKFQFKALPLPDYFYKRSMLDARIIKQKIHTKPDPFGLSKTNRRARSHSPPSAKSRNNSDKSLLFLRTLRETNVLKVKQKNKLSKKFAHKTRRKSIKSRHRFTLKHQGKVLKSFRISEVSVGGDGFSVNPNLNAGKAAREKHLLKVAADVAKLREEWERYKAEAQRISMEIERANAERKKLRNQLALSTLERSDIVDLRKQLEELDRFVEFKVDLLIEYNEKIGENEQKQRTVSAAYKRKKANEKEKSRQPSLIYGKHRSLRRVGSFKKTKKPSVIPSSHEENKSAFKIDKGHQYSKFQINFAPDKTEIESGRSKENEPIEVNDMFQREFFNSNRELEDIGNHVISHENDAHQVEVRKADDISSRMENDIEAQDCVENNEMLDSEWSRESLRDTNLDVLGDNHMLDSRDTEEETTSQRSGGLDDQIHNEGSSQQPKISNVKETRPKGDFGDDFAISSLTTMFRGGWQRALRHEHLAGNNQICNSEEAHFNNQAVSSRLNAKE